MRTRKQPTKMEPKELNELDQVTYHQRWSIVDDVLIARIDLRFAGLRPSDPPVPLTPPEQLDFAGRLANAAESILVSYVDSATL